MQLIWKKENLACVLHFSLADVTVWRPSSLLFPHIWLMKLRLCFLECLLSWGARRCFISFSQSDAVQTFSACDTEFPKHCSESDSTSIVICHEAESEVHPRLHVWMTGSKRTHLTIWRQATGHEYMQSARRPQRSAPPQQAVWTARFDGN